MKDECGMVLMIVMMILLLLNLFGVAMLQMVRMEIKMTSALTRLLALPQDATYNS